jgi:hypothetical protein
MSYRVIYEVEDEIADMFDLESADEVRDHILHHTGFDGLCSLLSGAPRVVEVDEGDA